MNPRNYPLGLAPHLKHRGLFLDRVLYHHTSERHHPLPLYLVCIPLYLLFQSSRIMRLSHLPISNCELLFMIGWRVEETLQARSVQTWMYISVLLTGQSNPTA
jgi:hypothetical protein